MEWQIIDFENREEDSSWIEEEKFLLNWAENPVFNNCSLTSIAISFIYVNTNDELIGIVKSSLPLQTSGLIQSVFTEKITIAKNPSSIGTQDWLKKQYLFKDSIIFYPSNNKFHPLSFSNEIAKIPQSISILHDLYEIIVIMREISPPAILKSIIKNVEGNSSSGGGGKTKKVRISDDSPEIKIIKRTKRKTQKIQKKTLSK